MRDLFLWKRLVLRDAPLDLDVDSYGLEELEVQPTLLLTSLLISEIATFESSLLDSISGYEVSPIEFFKWLLFVAIAIVSDFKFHGIPGLLFELLLRSLLWSCLSTDLSCEAFFAELLLLETDFSFSVYEFSESCFSAKIKRHWEFSWYWKSYFFPSLRG